MPMLDPRTTALVLIDLQNGIVGMPLAPHSGDEVLKTSKDLIAKFRAAGSPIVLVRAVRDDAWVKSPVDAEGSAPAQLPPGWTDLVEGLAEPGDILVTKRQWGAFYGTDLDLQLRRRDIQTIVLGGIATNMGVESTARDAYEHNYALVIVEDATSSRSIELHAFAYDHIFPRLSRVVKAADVSFQA